MTRSNALRSAIRCAATWARGSTLLRGHLLDFKRARVTTGEGENWGAMGDVLPPPRICGLKHAGRGVQIFPVPNIQGEVR